MPRISHLAVACALAIGSQAAQAQQFSSVISFGDSLSDAGNVGFLGSGGLLTSNSFTTNPDPVWAQLVAAGFGFNQTASLVGGTNYAYGGACARANTVGPPAFTCVNSPSSFSLTTQMGAYLAANGGSVDPDALYTVWAGANDIFTALGDPATAGTVTGSAALTTVANISALQAAGANYIVVLNLPNIGATPQFSNAALFPLTASASNSASLTGLSIIYNDTFNAGLATLDDGIIPINVFGLVEEVRANPGLYGFTNFTGVACLSGGLPISSVGCGPANYATPTANQTYFFADGVHPSGAGHAILAQVVMSTISAPGQVSLAAELPLQVYDDHAGAIQQASFDNKINAEDVGNTRGFAQAQFGNNDYAANGYSPALDTNTLTFTGGFEYRYSEKLSLGAAVSFGGSNGDFGTGGIDGQEILGSVFATGHFGNAYLNGMLSLGASSIDINRNIVLGPTVRNEEGNAGASHKAASLSGGFLFGDTVRHGPFASVTWQTVGVNDYIEESGDSTAMRFDSFDRDSLVGRIGYQLQGSFGGERTVRPSLRVAYASESNDDVTRVTAGSASMNGHFTMDGYAPSDNWIEADLSLSIEMSDAINGYIGYHGRLSDDNQDNNSFNLGVNVAF